MQVRLATCGLGVEGVGRCGRPPRGRRGRKDADGAAAGVGADGDQGRAFLEAGGCSAGGASGEEGGVLRLEAVAVVAVFSCDSVGELSGGGFFRVMTGSDVQEPLGDPGIFCKSDGVVLGGRSGAGGGDGAVQVEAVFEGRWGCRRAGASVGVGVEGRELLGAFGGIVLRAGVM